MVQAKKRNGEERVNERGRREEVGKERRVELQEVSKRIASTGIRRF